MTPAPSAAIEAVARAICESCGCVWDRLGENDREELRDEARAAWSAVMSQLSEQGMVVISRELAKECAEELAEWVENHYAKAKGVPSIRRRYERDIEPANKLKAMLSALADEKR